MKKKRISGKDTEKSIIRHIIKTLPATLSMPVGPGDDCAVVRTGDKQFDYLLTSDPVTETVHFAKKTSPHKIGHKALARSLSDIAAMGGEPLWGLVNIQLPKKEQSKTIKGILSGMKSLAKQTGLAIAGGDISKADALSIHVFCIGRIPRGRAILRKGAHPGDLIFVTGELGGSIYGKHLSFTPRLKEGKWLAASGAVTSMIDLSDGVSSDLRHILEVGKVGALLEAKNIPVSPCVKSSSLRSAINHALSDGEDFELLFTVRPQDAEMLLKKWRRKFSLRCTIIGQITARKNRLQIKMPNGIIEALQEQGFDHFEK